MIWIGKDNDGKVRGQLGAEPEAGYKGLTWEAVENYENPNKKHILRTLALHSVLHKEIYGINYITELLPSVRLEPVRVFTRDGLLEKTEYYYTDEDAVKHLVLVVSEDYEYYTSDMDKNPSERTMYSRTKTWQYALEDGTLDVRPENIKTKVKYYKTNRSSLVIGRRRRENIKSDLSENLGILLMVLGIYTDKKAMYNELRNYAKAFSTDFNEYEKYANTDIYTTVQNDPNHAWQDTYVPSQAEIQATIDDPNTPAETVTNMQNLQGALNLYKLTEAQGKTMRVYIVEKLKGLVY